MVVKGSREEGGDFAVSNGPPQCGAHAGEGLSDRYFTSQDIPVKEVTSSPPNGPDAAGHRGGRSCFSDGGWRTTLDLGGRGGDGSASTRRSGPAQPI